MLGLVFIILISCLRSLLDPMLGLVFIVSSFLDLVCGLSFSPSRLIFTSVPILKPGDDISQYLKTVVFNLPNM